MACAIELEDLKMAKSAKLKGEVTSRQALCKVMAQRMRLLLHGLEISCAFCTKPILMRPVNWIIATPSSCFMATILSAQCTTRVDLVTPALFTAFSNARSAGRRRP